MTPQKRLFDLILAGLLSLLLAPLLLILIAILLVREGRPIFYVAERMKTPEQGFGLVKLRTMRPAESGRADSGSVTGGDKAARMSRLHRALRRTRADEIPQLWNVLRGDMSFVGPRPPLRVYVEAFPELYADVLRSRPGITGLASLIYHAHEERILDACRTPAETDRAYRRRCVPRKARLDLLHARQATLCGDAAILVRTLRAVLQRR